MEEPSARVARRLQERVWEEAARPQRDTEGAPQPSRGGGARPRGGGSKRDTPNQPPTPHKGEEPKRDSSTPEGRTQVLRRRAQKGHLMDNPPLKTAGICGVHVFNLFTQTNAFAFVPRNAKAFALQT